MIPGEPFFDNFVFQEKRHMKHFRFCRSACSIGLALAVTTSRKSSRSWQRAEFPVAPGRVVL
jgi:hypothetical protein